MDVDNEIQGEKVDDDTLDQADNSDTTLLWEEQTMDSTGRKNKRRRTRKRGKGKGRKGRTGEDISDNKSDELSTSVPSSATGVLAEQVTKVYVIEKRAYFIRKTINPF